MKECDEGRLHPLVQFATRMAVMVFVRATCSRSGSAATYWFGRAKARLECGIYCNSLIGIRGETGGRLGFSVMVHVGRKRVTRYCIFYPPL
jgi:hypothetical protein